MCNEKKSEPISIESDLFQGFRSHLDLTLEETLQTMVEKNCSEATITAKIEIELANEGDQQHYRVKGEYLPSFSHSILSSMTIKSKKKGVAAGHYRMVYDEELGCWVCVDTESQTSFVSGDGSVIVMDAEADGEDTEDYFQGQLPSGISGFLEGGIGEEAGD